MGNFLSSSSPFHGGGTKRKRPLEDSDSEERESDDQNTDIVNIDLHTPKRKKMKSTSKYIYETLFVNGENSDITIVALGREWKLHKVYVCQSGYFSSMFNGGWKESNQKVIRMEIPDQNIDEEALNVAFGSLYRDDVYIKPARVISILAAASLLHLEGLIQQCADTMKETISSKTVCSYCDASYMYGLLQVTKKCKEWLEKNLMTSQNATLLREISYDLMFELVSSPDLFVMQVEMDIYTMLKKWVFLRLSPNWHGSSKQLVNAADDFFKKEENRALLRSTRGKPLLEIFRGIRLWHVINDITSANLLQAEGIIPEAWLFPLFKQQWHQMLAVEQGIDKGPDESVSHDVFYRETLRCGRVLPKEGEYCWRWTGFNYGIDLLVTFANKLLLFKRNTHSQSYSMSLSLQQTRNIMFRVSVASFDLFGQPTYLKSSGIMRLSLGKDEEAVIMAVDRHVTFPLHVSVNILYFTPNSEFKELPEPDIISQAHPESTNNNPKIRPRPLKKKCRRKLDAGASTSGSSASSSDAGDTLPSTSASTSNLRRERLGDSDSFNNKNDNDTSNDDTVNVADDNDENVLPLEVPDPERIV
ncbi:germ cell-less protein-like 1 [Lineus longissimus]|uniref:germ cell-less protein-like 1 n=1 Tax=Lineus longissimus TaxID=88925 RepID=UPI002B4F9D51